MLEQIASIAPAGARGSPSAREPERKRGIDRVVDLLDALLRHRAPMRIGDLARVLEAPRSTTYEIVNRLIEADMLEPVGDGGEVFFGRAMHLYGQAYGQGSAANRRTVEVLERLNAETGSTTQLCGMRGNKYVVLDSRDAPGPFRITSDIGVEVPLPWTASGRLLVAHMDDDEILAFIPPEDYRLPDGRLIGEETFLADVRRTREDGWAETLGLADRFTCCLAAPIRDASGLVRRTLCLVLPADTPVALREHRRHLLVERASSLSN